MDKLYDLMTMPFKYQTLLCKESSELLLITLNHFNGIKECFQNQNDILTLINTTQALVNFKYFKTIFY